MPERATHRLVAADAHTVPGPFRAFAVRSDEARHAFDARAPYGRVHLLRPGFLNAHALGRLAALGFERAQVESFSDIEHAAATLQDLAAAAPDVSDLAGRLARALELTGVLGAGPAAYRASIEVRVDFLATCGAGFHNDVNRHGCCCLYWLLALHAADVEFVMPHAGVRLGLTAGDLIVFDPTMAHGLCRPADDGQAVAASFDGGAHRHQMFLTGELLLDDAQWAALGSPWLPVEAHASRGALDLMVAEFDDRSGAIKRLRTLRDGLSRSTCHVDAAALPARVEPPEATHEPGEALAVQN
jgi:hypothetical protein